MQKVYQFEDPMVATVFSYYAIEKNGVYSTDYIDGSIGVTFTDDATPKEIKVVTGLAGFNGGKVVKQKV